MIITKDNADLIDGRWYIDASELGIPPGGRYPAQLDTTLGNSMPFTFRHFDANQTAHYHQQGGSLELRVWND